MDGAQKQDGSSGPRRLGRRTSTQGSFGREQLADVALELFAKRHFSAVSIRDISRAANVNSAMIYYHFRDKEDLVRAALESAVHEAFSLFEGHSVQAKQQTAAEAIDAWFDVHVRLYRRLRNVIKISVDLSALLEENPASKELVTVFYRRETEILEDILRRGVVTGEFRSVDPVAASTMISTILDGALMRTFMLEDFDLQETISEFKKMMRLYLGC